jgi:hypothetical protein
MRVVGQCIYVGGVLLGLVNVCCFLHYSTMALLDSSLASFSQIESAIAPKRYTSFHDMLCILQTIIDNFSFIKKTSLCTSPESTLDE